jgi:hypothetical protein
MATAIYFAKSMVRKAREVQNLRDNRIVCKACDAIEFLVLMTLPFFLPFAVMYFASL